jgi:hypothetical protein
MPIFHSFNNSQGKLKAVIISIVNFNSLHTARNTTHFVKAIKMAEMGFEPMSQRLSTCESCSLPTHTCV